MKSWWVIAIHQTATVTYSTNFYATYYATPHVPL